MIRLLATIFIISLVFLSSCLEKLDDNISSFRRVFGSANESSGSGILRLKDDGFLIYGTESKININQEEEDQTFEVPLLIRTDSYGNELFRRTFLKERLVSELYGESELWDFASVLQVTELRDEGFVAIIRYDTDDWVFYQLMYLHDDLSIDTLLLLNDTPQEITDAENGILRLGPLPILELQDGDLILVFERSIELVNNQTDFTRFPTVYRINQQKEITWIADFPSPDNTSSRGRDITLDDDANLVIVGLGFNPTQDILFKKIDLNSGTLIDEEIYEEGVIHFAWRVVNNGNGFTVMEYYRNSQNILDPDGIRRFFGALTFVDDELNLVERKNITDSTLIGARDMIQTADKGYASIFFKNNDDYTVVRTDEDGQIVWNHDISNVDIGLNCIQETLDGGIVVLVNQNFNDTGNRITLLKFDANGNLF